MQQVNYKLILILLPLLSQVPLFVYNAIPYTHPYLAVALQPYLILLVGGLEAQVIVQFNNTIFHNYSPLLVKEQPQESYGIPSFSVLCLL